MEIRKFVENDINQVLEICRKARNYHIEILHGYFKEQDDNEEFEQRIHIKVGKS